MNYFTQTRPLTQISSVIFIIHASITGLVAIVLGPSSFISYAGAALIIVLDLAVFLSLRFCDRRSAPIILVAAWFVLVFFLARLSAWQILPAVNIRFAALAPFTPEEITRGLAYIVAGYLALWAGIAVGASLFGPLPKMNRSSLPVLGIGVYSALAVAAAIYIYFIVDVSVYSPDPTKWGSRQGWISIIFNIDVALLAAIVWLFLNRSEAWSKRLVAYAIIAIWLIIALMLGSRGGPLRIMILVGLAVIAIYGNPLTSWARVVTVVVGAFIAGSLLYPLATLVRLAPTSGDNATAAMVDDWSRKGEIEDQASTFLRQVWINSVAVQKLAGAVSPVIKRLGLVDYPIAIVTREPDKVVIDHYLSISYSLKNFANNLVPGELFPESDIMTSRVFNMAYRGYDRDHVQTYFLSEPWTIWGISWIKGGAIGGVIIIFVMAFSCQVIYLSMVNVFGPVSPYVETAYLFLPVAAGLLMFFGLDHALTSSAHFAAAMVVLFSISLAPRAILAVCHVVLRWSR